MNPALAYARTQADGLDNIAPSSLQGQQAWQYAQSDNYFSPEEQAAVMQKQLEPYRQQIQQALTDIGFSPAHLAKYPNIEADLFSGRSTQLMNVVIGEDITMRGTLRVVMTSAGPDILIKPTQPELNVPLSINGASLSKLEQRELTETGELSRPLLVPENGQLVPTYLRVDKMTNTVDMWRVRAEDLPTKLLGIDLSKDQQQMLVAGYPVRLSGLLDRQGEPFDATVRISAAEKSLNLADFSRQDVVLRPDQAFRNQLAQNNEGAKTDVTQGREIASKTTTATHQQSELLPQLLTQTDKHEQDQSRGMRR